MMTPLADPQSLAENEYQRKHIRTRNLVERSIGAWKRRFNCLMVGFQINVMTALIAIVACGVLWNFLKGENDEHEDDQEDCQVEFEFQESTDSRNSGTIAGKQKQIRLIEQISGGNINSLAI